MTELDRLLENWESVYKKGLLTFWLLLLLDEKPRYPYEMSAEVMRASQGTLGADDNSIYRAVSRFEEMGLVASEVGASSLGPPRKYYHLTDDGRALLRRFIERNVLIFQHSEVAERIRRILEKGATDEQ